MTSAKRAYNFPLTPRTPRCARRIVRSTVLSWSGTAELADTAELLTSELVTNVVQHSAASPLCLVVCQRSGDLLTVQVIDLGGGKPACQTVSDTALHGRGLFLVSELAWDWGVQHFETGKATFFQLQLAPELPRARPPAGECA